MREADGTSSHQFDLKIVQAAPHAGPTDGLVLSSEPGRTCRTGAKGLVVRCGAGSILHLLTVQPASKKAMPISAYLNGLSAEAELVWSA